MTSMDKLIALCGYHIIPIPDSFSALNGGAHDLLDELDGKIGVDTRGGLHHDAFCRGFATPDNYVGTRIRLHEEYIRKDAFEPHKYSPVCYCVGCFPSKLDNHHFWLGEMG